MRRLLVLAALAGAIGGGLWAAPRLVPPETLAHWFVARAEADLGAELRVAGESRLDLLPRPALTLGAVRTTTPLGPLHAEGARIVFDWRRLVGGEAAVAAARLDRPRLVVVAPPPRGELAALLAGVVAHAPRLELRDGQVVIPDGADVELRRLVVEPDGTDRRLDADGRWRGRDLRARAVVAPEEAGRGIVLRALDLTAGADRLALRGRLGARAGEGELELDLADPAALRAWLPSVPAPPLLADLAAARTAPLAIRGTLEHGDADWRLREAGIEGERFRLAGTLGVAAGRLDARLELIEAPPLPALLAAAAARSRAAPARLDDIARLALDGPGLRLRLDREDGGLAASLRATLPGASELGVEGRVAGAGPRFDGTLTLVSDDLAAALPEALAGALPRPTALTLTGKVRATSTRAALTAVRLAAPGLAFRGDVELVADGEPPLTVAGVVDRLRLPAAALRTPAGRRGVLARLRELAERGGAAVDLEIGRLLLDDGGGLAGRLVAELDRHGLWVTAFEAEGAELGLSLTGGLELAPARLDALGALQVGAPGRLVRRLTGRSPATLATVPGGRFDVALRGPLEELAVELDGRLGALDVRLDGATRPLASNDLAGTLGAPPHPRLPLAGPARFEGAVARDDGWSLEGEIELAELGGALRLERRRLAVTELAGPAADLHAALTALTPWPADLARWRARVQGDWPATAPLATAWPAPFAFELHAPALVAGAGEAAALELALTGTTDRLRLETLRWTDPARRYRLAGTVRRGDRGVRVELAGALADAATAAVPTALGLGWLGGGEIELEGALRSRGTTPGELAAALDGTLAVDGTLGPSRRRGVGGGVIALPALALAGELRLDAGRFDLAALDAGAVELAGVVDLFADRLAARLQVPDRRGPGELIAQGRLARPTWRRGDAALGEGADRDR
ncbi:MAG: hypothetical protein GVY33_13680 [Alphaproteobacteria bacterium]|nr:hypothetical protein [Alphaproteobacteria bacterium]